MAKVESEILAELVFKYKHFHKSLRPRDLALLIDLPLDQLQPVLDNLWHKGYIDSINAFMIADPFNLKHQVGRLTPIPGIAGTLMFVIAASQTRRLATLERETHLK
ncbi:MAG: hypothetical protein ACRC62_23505 [Microcoleus sp.]